MSQNFFPFFKMLCFFRCSLSAFTLYGIYLVMKYKVSLIMSLIKCCKFSENVFLKSNCSILLLWSSKATCQSCFLSMTGLFSMNSKGSEVKCHSFQTICKLITIIQVEFLLNTFLHHIHIVNRVKT